MARKLATAGPAPLKRALGLGLHLDTRFWTETLQLTPAEIDEIKASIRLHDALSKKAGVEDFDEWFYSDICVGIQEWRGGYTHVEVQYPSCPSEKPKTIDLYCGNDRERLWDFELPTRAGDGITQARLALEWNGHRARLYALGGRFESASPQSGSPRPTTFF